jgi:hypothetical protein
MFDTARCDPRVCRESSGMEARLIGLFTVPWVINALPKVFQFIHSAEFGTLKVEFQDQVRDIKSRQDKIKANQEEQRLELDRLKMIVNLFPRRLRFQFARNRAASAAQKERMPRGIVVLQEPFLFSGAIGAGNSNPFGRSDSTAWAASSKAITCSRVSPS